MRNLMLWRSKKIKEAALKEKTKEIILLDRVSKKTLPNT